MALLGPGATKILTENTKTAGGKSGKLIKASQGLSPSASTTRICATPGAKEC